MSIFAKLWIAAVRNTRIDAIYRYHTSSSFLSILTSQKMQCYITFVALFSINFILATRNTQQSITKRWPETATAPALSRYRYGHALDKSRLTTRSRHRSKSSHLKSRLDHVSTLSTSSGIGSQSSKETESHDGNKTEVVPEEYHRDSEDHQTPVNSITRKTDSKSSPLLNDFDSHQSKTILPLKRINNLHSNIQHPHISFQLRLNRALKRHSIFTQTVITDQELMNNLQKRADSIGYELEIRNDPTQDEPQRRSLHLRKRDLSGPIRVSVSTVDSGPTGAQSGQPFDSTGSGISQAISPGMTDSQSGQAFAPTGSVPEISSGGTTGSQSGQPCGLTGAPQAISPGMTVPQGTQPFIPAGPVPEISPGTTGSQTSQPYIPTSTDPEELPGTSDPQTSPLIPTSRVPEESSSPTTNPSNSSSSYSPKKLRALLQNLVTEPSITTANNSIGFSIHSNDVAYFVSIKVGSPAQDFNVILDSGSSDFWLSGPRCTNPQLRTQTCFHKSLSESSTTYKPTNKPFQITYGTGHVSGFLIQEDIEIAGLKLKSHMFGAATQESNEFASKNVPFDGLMGTALSSLSTSNLITPIEALSKSGQISGAFIGYALGRSEEDSNIGQVTIGGVDRSKFVGDLIMLQNINPHGFWEASLTSLLINKAEIISSRTAIFDTGTSLMLVPFSDAQHIHASIPGARADGQGQGQGSFTIPCETDVRLGLVFGGKEFQVKASDLAVQPVNLNDLKGRCLSGIVGGQVGGSNQWLLGDLFLKNVYFATDASRNQIGLAVIKNNV